MEIWEGEGGKQTRGGGGELLCDKDYWDKNLGKKRREFEGKKWQVCGEKWLWSWINLTIKWRQEAQQGWT